MKLDLKEHEKNAYYFLLILTIFSTVVFQLWRTLFNNFGVETIGLNSDSIGLIQAVREIPGFMAFLVIYLIIFLKEKWLAMVSLFMVCLGVSVTGYFPSKWGLMATTFTMSLGFHFYATVNQSLSMQYFSTLNYTTAVANIKKYGALSAIFTGMILAPLTQVLSYKELYLGAGLFGVIGSFYAFKFLPDEKSVVEQKKGIVLKKEYWLFYALTFLNGARRQIFVVFALFLLVERHKMTAGTISILFVANNIVNFFIYPMIAKMINTWGEKLTLRIEYISLFLIFLMYALIDHPYAALSLYILDNLFFAFSMATRSYFQKIAMPEDLAPTSGVSFTINHIAAVIMPFVGGLLWMVDWRIPFLMGVVITVLSFLLTRFIDTEELA